MENEFISQDKLDEFHKKINKYNSNIEFIKKYVFKFWPKKKKEKYILNWLYKFYLILSITDKIQVILGTLSEDKSLSLYAEITKKLLSKVSCGIPLSDALKEYPEYFGNLYLFIEKAEISKDFNDAINQIVITYNALYNRKISFYTDVPAKVFNLQDEIVILNDEIIVDW